MTVMCASLLLLLLRLPHPLEPRETRFHVIHRSIMKYQVYTVIIANTIRTFTPLLELILERNFQVANEQFSPDLHELRKRSYLAPKICLRSRI